MPHRPDLRTALLWIFSALLAPSPLLAQKGSLGQRVQYLHENVPGVQSDADPYEAFGNAVASGDFNADGIDDLAVGVYNAASGTVQGAGAVHVFYGRSGTALYPLGQYWTSDLICGEPVETNDHFGTALAAGDFDGDGVDDLAIGSPFEDVGENDAGLVQIVFGLRGVGLSNSRCQKWHQDSPGIAGEAEEGDYFGWELAAADFDGDGIDDLAVGAPGEDLWLFGLSTDAGAVQVLRGQWGTGLTATGSLWLEEGGSLQGDSLPGSVEWGDNFGHALAAGDLNGDGVEDLAIGAPFEDDAGGGVIVVYGRRTLGLTGRDSQWWSQNSAGVPDTKEALDEFGAALAIGDWNADGFGDLAVGVPYEQVGAAKYAGMIHILNGSVAGLTATGTLQFTQDSGTIADAVEYGDVFGIALTSGDFTGDGIDDLAVSASGETLAGGDYAGVVHLLKGSATGITTAGNRLWSQDSPNVGGVSHPFARFGAFLAAGDFDGDGAADLAVACPQDDPGVLDAGSVNVLLDLDEPVLVISFP